MAIRPELHANLDRLVGTWRTEGRIVDSGEEWNGYDIYEWFPGEQQLVHRVDVTIFGERTESIEIFTPRDDSVDTFDQTAFAADGHVEHAVGSFDAAGRYHNDAGEARAILAFDAPAAMSASWQLHQPEDNWSDWMTVRFTRIGEPHIEVRSKPDHRVVESAANG